MCRYEPEVDADDSDLLPMCKRCTDKSTEMEFDLAERFTFLEYQPVRRIRRAASAPELRSTGDESIQCESKSDTIPTEEESDGGTQWSVGSSLHSEGQCKPCLWFWRPESCRRGAECQHCHLCPPSAVKEKKRENRRMARASRAKLHGMPRTPGQCR